MSSPKRSKKSPRRIRLWGNRTLIMIYLVNESFRPEEPGDVEVFASRDAIALEYEWWFAKEPHLIVDTHGQTYKLFARNEKLHVRWLNRKAPFQLVKQFAMVASENSDLAAEVAAAQTFEELHVALEQFLGWQKKWHDKNSFRAKLGTLLKKLFATRA